MPLDANRFHINTEELTFDEAKLKCENMGAKLFEPKSIHENEFVSDLTKNYGANEYWIGILGHQVYSSDNSPITWSYFSPLDKIEEDDKPQRCATTCFDCGEEEEWEESTRGLPHNMSSIMGERVYKKVTLNMWRDQDCSLQRMSVCDKQLGKPSFYILSSY